MFNRYLSFGLRNHLALAFITLAVSCYPIIGTLTVVAQVPSRPFAVGYRIVYLGIALGLLLLYLPSLSRRKIAVGLIALIGFWIAYVGRIIYGFYVIEDFVGYARNGPIFFLQYGVGGCLIPAVAAGIAARDINVASLVRWLGNGLLCSGLACVFFLAMEQGFSFSLLLQRARLGEESVVSPIIFSQTGGGLLVLGICSFLLAGSSTESLWFRSVKTIVGFIVLIMGASRGPMLVVSLITVLLLWQQFLWRHSKLGYWLKAGVALTVLLAFTAIVVLPNFEDIAILNRISNTVEKGQGVGARETQWTAAWGQFTSSPLVGDRLIENGLKSYPHNIFLEVLMSTGLFGGLFFFSTLFIFVWRFLQRKAFPITSWPLFYLLLAYFGFAMFSSALITLVQFWVLLALTIAMPRLKIVT